MQAGRNTTAVVLFVVAFVVALHFFLSGRHEIAWMLLLGAFLLAFVRVLRGGGR